MTSEEIRKDTADLIEDYLIRSEFPFEKVDEGFWLIHDEFDQIDNIVIYYSPPVVTFRVKLLNIPDLDDETRLELYGKLLELNATSMVAGAYGLEDESVVVVDTLQAENLDFNEFQASIDSMALSIREHYRPVRHLVRGEPEGEEGRKAKTLDEVLEASADEETDVDLDVLDGGDSDDVEGN
jgi:hypothetical protein